MKLMEYHVKKYTKEFECIWDEFVENDSINGTFLQTRRFLNYHPVERFKDASLLLFDKKNNLVAVCPACELCEENKKIFYSHRGSTFGGIIVNYKNYKVINIISIVKIIEVYLQEQSYDKVYYKITPDIFAKELSDVLQYGLYYNGYTEYKEINSVVLFEENYDSNILVHLQQGKRTNVHNCIKEGIQVRTLVTYSEIKEFHNILCETLSKYNLNPIHTVEELLDFKHVRLEKECEIFGAFLNEEMVAGSMMFYFENVKCAHAQYLVSKHKYNKLSPMSFMYYSMMLEMYNRKYQKLSWGITSDHFGKELNAGLTLSKEAFGSKHSINRIYYKELEERL